MSCSALYCVNNIIVHCFILRKTRWQNSRFLAGF